MPRSDISNAAGISLSLPDLPSTPAHAIRRTRKRSRASGHTEDGLRRCPATMIVSTDGVTGTKLWCVLGMTTKSASSICSAIAFDCIPPAVAKYIQAERSSATFSAKQRQAIFPLFIARGNWQKGLVMRRSVNVWFLKPFAHDPCRDK